MTEEALLQALIDETKQHLVTATLMNDMHKVTTLALQYLVAYHNGANLEQYLVAYHNGANLEECAMPVSAILPSMLREYERICYEIQNSIKAE